VGKTPIWDFAIRNSRNGLRISYEKQHITRCAIRCLAKYEVAQALHTCQQAAPRGPPKTVENPYVSACPPKGRKLCLLSKSYAYRRTLIKIGKNEEFYHNPLCRPNPGAKRAVTPPLDPTRPPFKNIGFPCVSGAPPLEFCWRPWSPRCRCYAYRKKVMLIAEPL